MVAHEKEDSFMSEEWKLLRSHEPNSRRLRSTSSFTCRCTGQPERIMRVTKSLSDKSPFQHLPPIYKSSSKLSLSRATRKNHEGDKIFLRKKSSFDKTSLWHNLFLIHSSSKTMINERHFYLIHINYLIDLRCGNLNNEINTDKQTVANFSNISNKE